MLTSSEERNSQQLERFSAFAVSIQGGLYMAVVFIWVVSILFAVLV